MTPKIASSMAPSPIRTLREQAGLSQARLAALLGVAPNTVARWERGERKPPPYVEAAITALTVSLPPNTP